MNILITGGAGYIGTELVRKLASNSGVEKIIVYDNLSRPNYNLFLGQKIDGSAHIQFVHGELLDSRTLRQALKDIDVVYHLAAKVTTPFANVDAHMYEQVNHWGTAELVYALEEMSVGKIIYASSAGVYGSSTADVDELTQPDPATFYGISKLRGEEHVRRLSSKMDTYIFRCGNVYGYSPSMRFDAVINKFVFEANFEKRITIHGDGSQSRSFIHIDSISESLANVIHSDLGGGTYNLVERSMKVMDVVDDLKQLLPDLEFILINQHIKLNNLSIKQNDMVNRQLKMKESRPLKEELKEFLERFRF
jgi:UDP-glucose 4-epimerase